MQINRLFEIVYLLTNKKTMTAKQLAAHFEVSVRTILRDIDKLTTAGIPLYTAQGKGGGISILDHYILDKTVISEDEQHQILFALQSLVATRHIDVEHILGRLQSFFEKTTTNWIEVDFSRWSNDEQEKVNFNLLKTAILKKHALIFTYFSWHGQTSGRKVYPLKLIFKAKSWYLQAYCLQRSDHRTFKISRIKQLELLAETFEQLHLKAPKIDLPDHPPPRLLDITFKIAASAAYRVYDEFGDQHITRRQDGAFIVTTQLPHDDWLYDYILSFGTCIEVLEPANIRAELVEHLEKIMIKHHKT